MNSHRFELSSLWKPQGDQIQAIQKLKEGLDQGLAHQVLLGVTGSGKTFTIANIIEECQRPALVVAPNKTLAAQLFQEFREFFPKNPVEYFISYYDYYQPEVYLPSSDTFIAKASTINQDIDIMRHSTTQSLTERKDVIIISSVSCLYGLGDPKAYHRSVINLKIGQDLGRDEFLKKLLEVNYKRNDISLERGIFRVRGDTVEVVPASERERSFRIEFCGNTIEALYLMDNLLLKKIESLKQCFIYPCSHYVTDPETLSDIMTEIYKDMVLEVEIFKHQGKWTEAERLERRTLHDLEMMREIGFCQGVENYSRYLDGRVSGEPPPTLLDYLPKNALIVIDESHITFPQISGMYRGDRARKENLVNFGFRLNAALDNRPLNFEEFMSRCGQIISVSATPGDFEMREAKGAIVEQVIRPTGLEDPEIIVKKADGQIQDVMEEIKNCEAKGFRSLIVTLTKKMSEEISLFMKEKGIKARYLHSDIDSIERVEILRDLRRGEYSTLVGINLLREGLDLPEVALVAILDADKEGFLRSTRSLIQIVGRAARNHQSRVILYGDKITPSMKQCMDETQRRRVIQKEYNTLHNITPTTISKAIPPELKSLYSLESPVGEKDIHWALVGIGDITLFRDEDKLSSILEKMSSDMKEAAQRMEFEKASLLRDKIKVIRRHALLLIKTSI